MIPLSLLPWMIVGVLVAVLGAGGGGYFAGRTDGRKLESAEHQHVEDAIAATKAATADLIADSIAKIEVKNVTIRQQAETVIREKPVYGNCSHDPDGLRLVNEALTGSVAPAGDGSLSGADAAHGSNVRGDDPQAH